MIGIYELSYLTQAPRQPTLDDYLRHMVHALAVCGEDHVGIGSDAQMTPFDTSADGMKAWNDSLAARTAAGIAAPGEGPPPFAIGLNRTDRCTVIADHLRRRGHPSRVAEKVLGANFARVFEASWSRARCEPSHAVAPNHTCVEPG